MFDASRVREALSNLVSNAIAHGDRHAKVLVAVSGTATCVEVAVENAGELADHETERLFEPLRQRDSPTARAHDTHLGWGCSSRDRSPGHMAATSWVAASRRICFSFELPKNAT